MEEGKEVLGSAVEQGVKEKGRVARETFMEKVHFE